MSAIRYRVCWTDAYGVERERVVRAPLRIAQHPRTGVVVVNGRPYVRVRVEVIGPEPSGPPAEVVATRAMFAHLRAVLAAERRRARLTASQARRSAAGGAESARRRRSAALAGNAALLAAARRAARSLRQPLTSRAVAHEVAPHFGLSPEAVRSLLRRAR